MREKEFIPKDEPIKGEKQLSICFEILSFFR